MAINHRLLGPQVGEEEVFAVEDLVFSTQLALQRSMKRAGVSNKELAERLGMSPGRVSQILSTKGPNLTLKTIGKIAHALGEEFEFVRRQKLASQVESGKARSFHRVVLNLNANLTPASWEELAANGSKVPAKEVA